MPLLSTQHPLVLTFGILGNIISIFVYLAPVPTFYHIYKKKSTESFQSLPYQVSMFSSMLWLYYALLKGSDTFLLITINSFGCIVETIYISLFFAYATKKVRISAMKLFVSMNIALVAIIILCIHFLIKDSDRIKVLGWTNVFISVIVFAAPLSIVTRVIKTKSVEFMPFTLSFFLTLSAIMWFGYGLFNKDMCIALPNVIGFVLGMLQMLLYAIYKNAKNEKENENMPTEQLRSIVIMKSLSTSEVHPLDVSGENVGNKDKHEEKGEKREKNEKTKQDSNDECPV